MFKLLLVGIWACLVSLGAVFGIVHWQKSQSDPEGSKPVIVIEEMRTKPVNVPVVEDGKLQGYMVVSLAFTVDATALGKMTVDPQTYLVDETFQTLYAGQKLSFHDLRKHNLPEVAKAIGEGVNGRIGVDLVQEVLFDQISYVPMSDMRGKPKR